MLENIVATASRLSDDALLARIKMLALREREATVDLVAHLAELDGRRAHLGEGPGSLPPTSCGGTRSSSIGSPTGR